jgi:hypothetical protein
MGKPCETPAEIISAFGMQLAKCMCDVGTLTYMVQPCKCSAFEKLLHGIEFASSTLQVRLAAGSVVQRNTSQDVLSNGK